MNFSDTSSTGQVVAQGSISAVLASFFAESVHSMIPFLIVAFIVVIVDLKFGIAASRHRGDKVRLSRAIRRTLDKIVSYLCWVVLAASLSASFHIPSIEFIILGIVIGIEVMSIFSNWLEMKGYRVEGFNLIKIIGDKAGIDVGEARLEKIEKNQSK